MYPIMHFIAASYCHAIQGPPGAEGSKGVKGGIGDPGENGTFVPSSATTYINWGRSDCPPGAVVVYEGRAVAPAFDNAGGGAEYLCLANSESASGVSLMSAPPMSTVVGVHLETFADPSIFTVIPGDDNIEPLDNQNGQVVECALCLSTSDTDTVMIPNSVSCPDPEGLVSWNVAYTGYLMTARDYISIGSLDLNHNDVFMNTETANHLRPHFRTEYVCLNQNFDNTGSVDDLTRSEAKMSHVRIFCAHLVGLNDGCTGYINSNAQVTSCAESNSGGAHCSFGPLSCAVCTASTN